MFGSNNAQSSNDDPAMLDSIKQLATDTNTQTATSPAQGQPFQSVTPPPSPALQSTAPHSQTAATAHPEPAPGFSSMPSAVPAPTTSQPTQPVDVVTTTPVTDSTATPVNTTTPEPTQDNLAPTTPVDHQQLAGMKQHALDHLEPLVGHLDQSPEEEFKTTMMMIQSNDNHTLLEKALDAAKRISDDTARAEALLDIINEINYFAAQNPSGN